MPKLVKNVKVVALPRASGSVKATLRRADDLAQKEGWTNIVIIGRNKNGWKSAHSFMTQDCAIALVERFKHSVIGDWE